MKISLINKSLKRTYLTRLNKLIGQSINLSITQLNKIQKKWHQSSRPSETPWQHTKPIPASRTSGFSMMLAACQAMCQWLLASVLLPDSGRSWHRQHQGGVWWHQVALGPTQQPLWNQPGCKGLWIEIAPLLSGSCTLPGRVDGQPWFSSIS